MISTAQAGVDGGAPPTPRLRWHDCGQGFQCSTAAVPLDYARPRGQTISLALIKLPATDSKHRVGSLFVNPGGPGGSGVDLVRQAGRTLFSGPAYARFDLIGFDPRGIGGSAPVRCFANQADELRLLTSAPTFPLNAAQNSATMRMFAAFAAACGKRNGEILRRVTTADAARDLDLLRAAVGDRQLNFYGLSYGTYFAAVYANLFPGRVRAVIADGVVDPIEYSQDVTSFFYRDSAVGAERTLDAFAADCAAAGARCALSGGDGAAVRHRIDAVLARLRDHPVQLPGKPAQVLTYQLATDVLLNRLYVPAGWISTAWWLAAIESLEKGKPAVLPPHVMDDVSYDNGVDALFSVMCSDSAVSHDPRAWPRQLGEADKVAPRFGRTRLYVTLACGSWPAASPDRYTGPFTARTANPVLVIGNTYDPATPISGARELASLLPNSRLLTLNGYGHTALLSEPSQCVQDAITSYLLTTKVPAKGTVCQPDRDPFDPGVTPPGVRGLGPLG